MKKTILLVTLFNIALFVKAQWSIPGPVGNSWISTNGNVGIGTASPQYGRLQIQAEGNSLDNEWSTHPFAIRGNDQTLMMGVNSTSHLSYIQSVDIGTLHSILQLNPRGGDVSIGGNLISFGNIGINTSNPQSKLHVACNENDGILIGVPNDPMGLNGGSYSIKFYGYRDVTPNIITAKISAERTNLCCNWLSQGSDLVFYTGEAGNTSNADISQERLRIKSWGSVGIGTSTPREKLDVNGKVVIGTKKTTATDYQLSVDGKVYCQEINVTPTSQWADYVFKKDYKLASLEEVEKHIAEKGHLENVPSAETVASNGYNVSDMNATLLRKIEELTLYIISQEKEIKALKSTVYK